MATFTTLTVEETDTKTEFWLVKIKWDNAKHHVPLTRKIPRFCFSFSDISYTFFAHFQTKLFICIHLSLFMRTVQNDTILSSFNITYWKLNIFLVKVQNALCRWNTRPLSLSEFYNYYKLYQGTAWINCKNNVSTERWNSRVEFHGKNNQPRKNLDKLTIYFFLNRILWAFQW